jgi:hypothetical protein
MADSFQLFSEIISAITGEERAWIEHTLACESDPQPVLQHADFELETIDIDVWPDFQWEFVESGKELWLHGDEYGNVSHVGEFVRAFLARFRPNQCWTLTWAETCSKPRIGEFGGGGLFVTAKSVTVCNATDWVNQQRRQFEQAGGRGKPKLTGRRRV